MQISVFDIILYQCTPGMRRTGYTIKTGDWTWRPLQDLCCPVSPKSNAASSVGILQIAMVCSTFPANYHAICMASRTLICPDCMRCVPRILWVILCWFCCDKTRVDFTHVHWLTSHSGFSKVTQELARIWNKQNKTNTILCVCSRSKGCKYEKSNQSVYTPYITNIGDWWLLCSIKNTNKLQCNPWTQWMWFLVYTKKRQFAIPCCFHFMLCYPYH